jgi:hypothetical protein
MVGPSTQTESINIDLNREDFGIQGTSVISDVDTSDILFGGPSATSNPEDIQPVKEEPKKEEKKEDKKEVVSTQETTDPEEVAELLFGTPKKEESEEEDSEEEVVDQPSSTKKDSPEENTFQVLAEELTSLGIFSQGEEGEEETITTPEQFKDKFIKEIQSQAQSQIYSFITSKYGQEGLDVFNSIFVQGVSPQEYLSKYAELETVKELDLSVEDNQKSVVREFYRRQGLPTDKVEKKLQRLIDTGDLEEEAADFHTTLVEQEEAEMQELVAERASQEKQKLQYKQYYVQQMNQILADKLKTKEFDGIPVSDKIARETFSYLTDDSKWQMPSGERLTEFDKDLLELRKPENYELKVKVALLLKNKMDLSKVKNKLASEKNNELFNKLATKDKIVKRTHQAPISKSFFD